MYSFLKVPHLWFSATIDEKSSSRQGKPGFDVCYFRGDFFEILSVLDAIDVITSMERFLLRRSSPVVHQSYHIRNRFHPHNALVVSGVIPVVIAVVVAVR